MIKKYDRKKFTRSAALFMAAAFALMSVTGCSEDEVDVAKYEKNTSISLSWWGTDDRNQYTLDGVKTFEALHPNITVATKYGEWTGYEKRMDIEIASSTQADVMQINYAWINQYSPNGEMYYDLNELSGIIDLSTFSDDVLQYGYMSDKLQAIPIALNSMTFYYNKTLYDSYGLEIPKTLDDLYEAAKVMSKDGIYPMSGATKMIWFFVASIEEQRSGKKIFNADGSVSFTEEQLKDMIALSCDLIENKVIADLSNYDKAEFEKGQYAGEILWISDAANSFSNVGEDTEVVIGDYIVEDKSKPLSWYVKPATMYAISKNTENPEESALLLDYLLNSKEMAMMQGIEKGIPLSSKARAVLEDSNMLQGIQYEACEKLEDNLDIMTKSVPSMENVDVIDAYFDAINKVLYNDTTLEDSAKDFYSIVKNTVG